MTLPLWGELQKSQDDSETIEQAIARIVAEHEADPEAHLGVGESLQNHKVEDVLDHPQGSVLADKWTNTELDFTTTFENLDSFFSFGGVFALWPGFVADPGASGYANRSGVLVDGESGGLEMNTANDLLLQVSFNIDNTATGIVVMRLGVDGVLETNYKRGMGAYIVGTTLKFFAGNADASSVNESAGITLNALQTYILRMFSNSNTEEIECYLDGVLVATLEWPTASYTDYANVSMYSWDPTNNGTVLHVKSLYFSIKP